MPSAKRILLVDGNAILRGTLAEQLAQEGAYDIVTAGSIAEARTACDESCAVAILDQNLPDGSGEALAGDLRSSGFSGPIFLLSDNSVTPAGDMFEAIAKPFRFSALLARLNAKLGRHAVSEGGPVRIGPYFFRPGAKLLTDGAERKIRLTEKETNILKFLHGAARTVPRETLLHEVWGYNPAVTTHTLETHIYRLRRKIEENPGKARILVTEGGGYRLA
jgi:DNA-binding response OmpR family regulator